MKSILVIRLGRFGRHITRKLLAVKYCFKNIFDYVEPTPEVAICEVAVPGNWIGKSIIEKSIRNRYSISILATKKEGKISPLPEPEHIFSRDEILIIMGDKNF